MRYTALFLALYLLIGSFFPQGDYSQILRIVELNQHFRLHIQQGQNHGHSVSFLEFVQMHFLNTQAHEGDHEQDHQDLPFQQINSSMDQLVIHQFRLKVFSPLPNIQQMPESTCSLTPEEFPTRIFHPPVV